MSIIVTMRQSRYYARCVVFAGSMEKNTAGMKEATGAPHNTHLLVALLSYLPAKPALQLKNGGLCDLNCNKVPNGSVIAYNNSIKQRRNY